MTRHDALTKFDAQTNPPRTANTTHTYHGILVVGELPLAREAPQDVAMQRAERPRPPGRGPLELETFCQVAIVPNLATKIK